MPRVAAAFALVVWQCCLTAFAAAGDIVQLYAGGSEAGVNVPAVRAKLDAPFGIEFDPSGNAVFVEMTGNRLLKIDPSGVLSLVAGDGVKGDRGDGGPAKEARFSGLHNLAITSHGDIYLADTINIRVRKIDAKTGQISTVAGNGKKGFRGDGGPAAEAVLGGPYAVCLDPAGRRLFIADLENRRIRAIDLATDVISTVAGNGDKGVPRDGDLATAAPLVDPRAMAVDRAGNLYILERSGHALRVVDPSGKIRTVAGTGKPGYSGDGGPALAAQLRGPKHLVIDEDQNVIIADTDNHVIRKYIPAEGKIVRVAGVGKKGHEGLGGSPLEVQLNQPHGVLVDPKRGLFIVDSFNHRILRVPPAK